MVYTCIKYPIPGLVYIFAYNDYHVSLRPRYLQIWANKTKAPLEVMVTFCLLSSTEHVYSAHKCQYANTH